MRVMIRFALPVEASNTAARTGKLEKVFKQIHEDLKPEAAYFFAQDGQRGGLFVVDMQDSSQNCRFCRALLPRTECESRICPRHVSGRFGEGIIWRSEHDPALRLSRGVSAGHEAIARSASDGFNEPARSEPLVIRRVPA